MVPHTDKNHVISKRPLLAERGSWFLQGSEMVPGLKSATSCRKMQVGNDLTTGMTLLAELQRGSGVVPHTYTNHIMSKRPLLAERRSWFLQGSRVVPSLKSTVMSKNVVAGERGPPPPRGAAWASRQPRRLGEELPEKRMQVVTCHNRVD